MACKATLVFHAGSTTRKMVTMTKLSRKKATLQSYNSVTANLDPMAFKSNAIAFFGSDNPPLQNVQHALFVICVIGIVKIPISVAYFCSVNTYCLR